MNSKQPTNATEPERSAGSTPAHGSVMAIEITGEETDEQCKDIAWQMFCNAHPVEAHAYDPDRFWKYFYARAPHMSREQMVALLKECEETENAPDQRPEHNPKT